MAGVNRRNMAARLLGAATAALVGWRGSAALAQSADIPKVAYHLADLDKVGFVLGNIDNHIKGMGGPEKVRIVLVVHGPALAAFQTRKANADISRHVAKILTDKVELAACGNTMDAQKISTTDLLPGFVRVDEGGVVRLAQLQAEGYAYLRP
jgi:intracellular sulfur oxidation DsrE/DsrF family protein